MEDWETDDDGNFKMLRFHGYESATSPGNVLLRMLYFTENPEMANVPDGVQFVMTPDMARKFAADVVAAAEQADNS
ncbi:hypothetical protein HFP51_04370 [Parasphingopyxis sp. CP4]|uniref:hypothetical protein n=1 Tax=Parasphingopyxis sp. CP4 TaxID=2724527 RepID=UPI0015A42803|nr:hypothetical protein [Parasphingopyxis sp. CP4]QLC21481.1 hypothetical protein HFP51_04370 [Parasphingopyxis sp. CP4]